MKKDARNLKKRLLLRNVTHHQETCRKMQNFVGLRLDHSKSTFQRTPFYLRFKAVSRAFLLLGVSWYGSSPIFGPEKARFSFFRGFGGLPPFKKRKEPKEKKLINTQF